MAEARSADRQRYCREVIDRQQASGQSIVGFCTQEGLEAVRQLRRSYQGTMTSCRPSHHASLLSLAARCPAADENVKTTAAVAGQRRNGTMTCMAGSSFHTCRYGRHCSVIRDDGLRSNRTIPRQSPSVFSIHVNSFAFVSTRH